MSYLSGASGASGASGGFMSADALILNRAAVVGPFTGASLHVREPGFDDPDNLAL